jgi:predicted peptidase
MLLRHLLLILPCCLPLATFADTQAPASYRGEFIIQVDYRYLLSHPEGYDTSPDRRWPLVVFLHGSGERGADLELLKKHGPPKLIAAGKKIPAVVASLQCPSDQLWNPHGVKAVTDHLIRTERIDPRRVYLTGLSMGGFGTWETAFEYPETYAAIAPICGGAGVRWVTASRLKHLPAWIFHGDQDAAVPVDFSLKIHGALQKIGAPVKLTIYSGVGHDSWTQTYDNPEFWNWLFAQKRPD